MEKITLEAGAWDAIVQLIERTVIPLPPAQVAQFYAAIKAAKVEAVEDEHS